MEGIKYDKTLLTDLQSFGCINYYLSLEQYDKLMFEQCEHHSGGSYSNRYYIAGPHGSLRLSIPLLHSGGGRTPIRDLKISNRDNWQVQHWRTMISAYRRSPWFEFYEPELKVMYSNKYKYLLDWNLKAFDLASEWLGIFWKTGLTDFYEFPSKNPNIVDGRHRFVPPEKGRNTPGSLLHYPQVFEDRNGFLPNLSILDLLFCEGRNAKKLLEKTRKDFF